MIDLNIRILTPEDAPAYWALRLEGLRQEPFAFASAAEDYEQTTVTQAEERIRNLGAQSFILGSFNQGTLIGTASFNRETGRKEQHKGLINGVYVTRPNQGRGVGRALMTTLINMAVVDPRLEQISLSVSTRQQAAFHLYTQLGFEVYSTELRALKIGSEYDDEYKMVLWVNRVPAHQLH